MSLSFKKKIDDAMFGEISRIPIFSELKEEDSDLGQSQEFRSQYMKSRSQIFENDKKAKVESMKLMQAKSKLLVGLRKGI